MIMEIVVKYFELIVRSNIFRHMHFIGIKPNIVVSLKNYMFPVNKSSEFSLYLSYLILN